MPKLTITRGLPGCGKTTRALEIIKAHPRTINLNLDDIRQMITVDHKNYKFNKTNEQLVYDTQMNLALNLIKENRNFVVSDTNLNPSVFKKWKDLAKENGYTFEVIDFFEEFKKDKTFEHEFFAINAFVNQCKERNLLRYKSVPPEVIDNMASVYYKAMPKVQWSVFGITEDAVIVDIDGTLAHMNGKRGPYEENKVLLDDADPEVILSVIAEKRFLNRKIIIMSGRHETCKFDTIQWLNEMGVPYDHLFMRAAGDDRPDDIVKYELFMMHVAGKFDVKKVYDDRDKVCFMWRHLLNLKVLQVAEGNF